MTRYKNMERLVIFDSDGTTVDAFHAIQLIFLKHGMDIGDLEYHDGTEENPETAFSAPRHR